MNRFGRYLQMFVAVIPLSVTAEAAGERRDGYVEAEDGTKLYYVDQGSGNDVLVITVAVYLSPLLLDTLSASRRVIFYDPRNRGRSEAADLSTASLERQVDDLEDLREALEIDRMALLGWSGSGMEMAVYRLRYPERVSRLIQVSPVPPAASIMREAGDSRTDNVDREALDAPDARFDAGEFDESPEEFCRIRNELTNPGNFVNPALAARVPDVCEFENEWPANLWPYFGALLPSFGDYDWREELQFLETPRLVIHGREDGIPIEGGRAWVAGYENARLIELSPSGHFPFIEQREVVLAAIEEFLDGGWPEGAQRLADN